MTKTNDKTTQKEESFAKLLDESIGISSEVEGSVLTGTIVNIDKDFAIVDVGLKSEGRIPLKEFASLSNQDGVKAGDKVKVYLERLEDRHGDIVLSREKARREETWVDLEKLHKDGQNVNGVIFGRVKGGFTVDLSGVVAFLPGSQVDIRPIKDVSALMDIEQPFQILKIDRPRGNIVVSRRAILEESRAEAKSELIADMEEGSVVTGIVKNITDYGAFIDLGGIDGLLHVTDISWKRINHPSDVLQVGESIKVKVIRFNKETQRVSLGIKQLEDDPWKGVEDKYQVGAKLKGRITNITDYGAFVELDSGVEGLIHVSEMSWVKKNTHPGKIVSTSQEVEVMVLEVDHEKRRISLGLKQCSDNPWDAFAASHPAGSEFEGPVKNITEFGLFVGLPGDIDGMVHSSDLSWEQSGDEALKNFNKGDMIKVKVLDVDPEKERISLGVKQLTKDTFSESVSDIKKGQTVTWVISGTSADGLTVDLSDGLTGFIKKVDLSRDRREQNPEKFAVGEKLDAIVSFVDKKDRKVNLSIKALEIKEEKEAMAEFGSSDSGAVLGDILGAALDKAKEQATGEEKKKPAAKKTAKAKKDEEEKVEETVEDK